MKIYREGSLSSFGFWSGAILNAEQFTLEYLASLIGLEWDSETGKIIR